MKNKKFVFLELDVESINVKQSNILIGYPSPIVMLSFIEKMKLDAKLKTDIHGEDHNLVYGFEKFIYKKDIFQRKALSAAGALNESDISYKGVVESHRANAIIKMVFDINSDEDNYTLERLIDYTVTNQRIAGGMIKRVKIKVDSNKENLMKKMFPCFLIKDARTELEYESVEDLMIKLFQNKYFHYELSTTAYSLLAKAENDTGGEYETYFSESDVSVIKKEVLTLKLILEADINDYVWNFDNTDDHIFAISNKYRFNEPKKEISEDEEVSDF